MFVLAPEEDVEIINPPNIPIIPPITLPVNLHYFSEPCSPPKILYISSMIRANAGKVESYVIKISEKKLTNVGAGIPEKTDKIINSITDSEKWYGLIKEAFDNNSKDKFKKLKPILEKSKKAFENFYPSKLQKIKG